VRDKVNFQLARIWANSVPGLVCQEERGGALSSKGKRYSFGTAVCRPATLGSRPEDSAFVLALLSECLESFDLLVSEITV